MNVKIIHLETTFKTVFVVAEQICSGKRVPTTYDGWMSGSI